MAINYFTVVGYFDSVSPTVGKVRIIVGIVSGILGVSVTENQLCEFQLSMQIDMMCNGLLNVGRGFLELKSSLLAIRIIWDMFTYLANN